MNKKALIIGTVSFIIVMITVELMKRLLEINKAVGDGFVLGVIAMMFTLVAGNSFATFILSTKKGRNFIHWIDKHNKKSLTYGNGE